MFYIDENAKSVDFREDPNNLLKYNTLFSNSEYLEVELCITTFYIREIYAQIRNENGVIVTLDFNYVGNFYTPTGRFSEVKDNERWWDKWTHCKLRLEEKPIIRQMLRPLTIANYTLYEENNGFFVQSMNLYIL
ncbi:MAG: hypothetical protein Q3983_08775 [Capnocytophaga sp.]|nr:hypothetical protein [Capnocytophaga sp.]